MVNLTRFIETCWLMARAGEWSVMLEFFMALNDVVSHKPPPAVTATVTLGKPEPIPGA